MRTTREQEEASTVETSTVETSTVELKMHRNPWRQPSRFAMSFRLGISYARGTGPVPV
jgi:hypothetical protein